MSKKTYVNTFTDFVNGFIKLKDRQSLYEYEFHGVKIDMRQFFTVALNLVSNYDMSKLSNREKQEFRKDDKQWIAEANKVLVNEYNSYMKVQRDDIMNTIVCDHYYLRTYNSYYSEIQKGSDFGDVYKASLLVAFFVSLQADEIDFKDFLESIYGTLDPMNELRYRTDLSLGIVAWLLINWAVEIIHGKHGKLRLHEIMRRHMGKVTYIDESYLDKMVKGKNSKFIKYLEGKISAKELIASRNKKYKTRVTDYQLDQIITARKIGGAKLNKYLDIIDSDDLQYLEERYTWNWKRLMIFIEEAYKHSMSDTENGLAYKDSKIEQLESKLKDTQSEKESLLEKINQIETQDERKRRKVEQLKSEVDALKNKVKELEKHKKLNESVDRFTAQINNKNEEIKELKNKLKQQERDLNETKRKYSETRKEARLLEVYKEYFGDLYIEDDEAVELLDEAKNISFNDMVETLKDYKFIICSYDLNNRLEQEFTKLGIQALIFNGENNPVINGQFDIAIIHATFCSHSMMYMTKNRAEQLGAVSLYFSGANVEKMLRAVYNELQK